MSVQENVRLAGLTTLGIGGPARYFARATSQDDVLEAVGFARGAGLPLVVIGAGSNLLVADTGYSGLVLQVAISGVSFEKSDTHATVRAGAGVDWDSLVAECVRRNLGGIECLSGIPGWVGGTPVGNVGAYGQEVSHVISSVRAYDQTVARTVDMSLDECEFGYRTSVFNRSARGRYIVLQVTYVLEQGSRSVPRYPDLVSYFEGHTGEIVLGEMRDAVRQIRASKAMLLVEGDPDCRSVGSFFKNPIVSAESLARIESAVERAGLLGPEETVPRFPEESDRFKVPAAWLIERSGFQKGMARERVGLSEKHTLALINRGDASAEDVLNLVAEIQTGVQDRFEVRLRPEPAFVGFTHDIVERFGAVSPG